MKKIRIFAFILSLITVISLFSGCGKQEVVVKSDAELAIENDSLIKPSQNKLFRYKIYDTYIAISEYIGEESNVTIPDTIEDKPVYVIDSEAFYSNVTVSKIIVSNNVVQIGESAFAECSRLKSLTLSNSLLDIPAKMCDGCIALESITIPDTVRTVGDSAFSVCETLEKIVIPSNVNLVGSQCFSDCANLKKVVFVDGVITDKEGKYEKTVEKEIGMSLFKNCESLESVLISDSVIKAEDTFLGMPSTTYVYGYVPSEIANICADEKINFVEVYEGDDKDRQMKDRSIVIPKTDEDK